MSNSDTRTLHTTMNEYNKRYEGLGTLIDAVVDDGCLGFLETNGWRGGVAILGCDTCDERFELPDRFAPTDASDSDTMVA